MSGGMIMIYEMTRPTGSGSLIWIIVIVGFLVLLTLMLILLFVSSRSYTLRIEDNILSIRSLFYNTSIAKSEIKLGEVRISRYQDLGVTLRTNGMALPGLLVGWFKGGTEKYKLYVTDKENVLIIPTTLGYSIAFSTREGQKIISDLRK
jgi:hypothetical protein